MRRLPNETFLTIPIKLMAIAKDDNGGKIELLIHDNNIFYSQLDHCIWLTYKTGMNKLLGIVYELRRIYHTQKCHQDDGVSLRQFRFNVAHIENESRGILDR